jgi:3-methyladenine DNA glycosylase AlkD
MPELEYIRAELHHLKNETLAGNYKRYLKSPYNFLGIRVPQLRRIAKEHSKNLNLSQSYDLFDELWNSGNHEEMCLAIFLMQNYRKQISLEMWRFLTRENVLNKLKTWDHVDALASGILGYILVANPNLNSDIKSWSESKNPWVRRLAIISQSSNIKLGKIQLTILLAEKLVYDEDIYVQKGAGWMLRECAKKNQVQVQEFIKIHKNMKPSALSYATEKMPAFKILIKKMIKEDKENKGSIFSKEENENNKELENIKYFQ